MSYFVAFVKSFFDIGNSAGSLFFEAITLFKTFQRISAPKVFTTKLSVECVEMFKWAKNIISYISNAIRTLPFKDYELFNIYTFIFPITIMIFISCSVINYVFLVLLFLIASFFALGMGVMSYLDSKEYMFFIIGGGSSLILIFIVIGMVCKAAFNASEEERNSGSNFTLSFFASIAFFYALLCPITLPRYKLAKIVSIIFGVIDFIVLVTYIVSKCCNFEEKLAKFQRKVGGFLVTCLPLFIIPSTECFSDLMQSNYKSQWPLIVSYLFNSIVVPISIIIAMIVLIHPNISSKYKSSDTKFYAYGLFELFDVMKQIGYAFAAVYDIIWACLVIEIVWIILVFAVRPYRSISEYSLSAGNSLIVIITNSALLYSEKHKSKQFSFGISVFFLVLACIPAIAALYLYFIFDFNLDEDEDDFSISSDSYDDDEPSSDTILSVVVVFMLPFSCFCFGLNYRLISKLEYIPYD